MRIAMISDIHGYMPGLEAFLAELPRLSVDRVVCLGDVVEGGGADVAVIDRLRELAIPCIRGNHDECNDLRLPADYQAWLNALPLTMAIDDWHLVHISPRAIEVAVCDSCEAWNCFEDCDFACCAIGHAHHPRLYRMGPGRPIEAQAFELNGESHTLEVGYRYLLACPSLAANKLSVASPGYAVVDTRARTVSFEFLDVPAMPLGW